MRASDLALRWGAALLGPVLAGLVNAACSAAVAGPNRDHPGLLVTPLEESDTEDEAPVSPPAAPRPTQAPAPRHDLPDPAPLESAVHWEYRLRIHEGVVSVQSVQRRVFQRPVATPRNMGRFAIELWIGRELIERVRFDFPLLGTESPVGDQASIHEAPRFEPGLEAERTVLVPSSDRATRAQLVDRATGKVQPLPWPPDAPLAPAPQGSVSAPGPADAPPIPE